MAKEMLFSVVCPTCEAKIGVHDQRLINQLVQCPKCGSIVQLTPPEGYGKSEDSPQKTEEKPEEKPERITPPSVDSIPQPISEKKVKNDNIQINRSAPPVQKASSVPVPPPASIPIPPPIAIPDPIAPESLMPEPMSPGGINSSSSSGGMSFSQRISSLSDKMPSWTPYLVIIIGVMTLALILVLFFFNASRKEVKSNDQPTPTTEINESEDNANKVENSIAEPIQNSEVKKNGEELSNDTVAADVADKADGLNSDSPVDEKDADNNEDLTDEIKQDGDSVIPDDKLENPDDADINNEPVENVENVDNINEGVTEAQPEDATQIDDSIQEPEQNDPTVDNPVENKDDALIAENDLTPDNINNNDSNQDNTPTENSQPDSELSSIPGLNVKLKSISIREQKLSQCLQTLRELGALPVEVNWDSLRRSGVNADDKISWSGKDVTVQTALSETLAQRGLMFKINSEGKIVFAPRVSVNARSDMNVDSARQGGSAMVKTQYSVSDLVGQSPEKTAELIKSIRKYLCPGDWKESGGTGTIAASGGGSVVVTQSQQNQWIIADFLDRLRLARRLAPLCSEDVSLEPMPVRAQSALKRNVGINFQPSADLKTALSEIGQRISVNILLDEASLKLAGISAQFPISFDAREMTLEETFHRINEETGLTYLAQTPNSFIVTTAQGAKSITLVEFYPISDLVAVGLTPAVLMEQIVKFEPQSWRSQDSASAGLIDCDSISDCLIVRQTPAVLAKISGLLTQLRVRLNEKK